MAAPTCTTCPDQPLEFHCETSPMCEWWKCPDCGAVYDVERGVRMLRNGAVETWAADG